MLLQLKRNVNDAQYEALLHGDGSDGSGRFGHRARAHKRLCTFDRSIARIAGARAQRDGNRNTRMACILISLLSS